MNKYLMLTAAALVGTAIPALAKQQEQVYTIQFLSGNGGSYCDGMSFYKSPYSGVKIELGTHLQTGCSAANVPAAGQQHKKTVDLVSNWQGPTTYIFDISRPVKNGGTWTLWLCQEGTSCFEGNSGSYKLGYNGAASDRPKTTAKVAVILAARRAAAGR
jgi:hypothetical protein